MAEQFITLTNNGNILYPITEYSCIKNSPNIIEITPDNLETELERCIYDVSQNGSHLTLFFNMIPYNQLYTFISYARYPAGRYPIYVASFLSYNGLITSLTFSEQSSSGTARIVIDDATYIPSITDISSYATISDSSSSYITGFLSLELQQLE